jgi:SAM-dependent methyltransferase
MAKQFSLYDTRHYSSVNVGSGYAQWAKTYDQTVDNRLDLGLLVQLDRVRWQELQWVADLGCGTGRVGDWLRQQGCPNVHGVDFSRPMLRQAATKQVYSLLCLADLMRLPLPSRSYDLCVTVLTACHLHDLRSLYAEGARILRPGGVFVLLDYHPFFLLRGIPTHFDKADGESIAIENVVHFFSDHIASGRNENWTLIEMKERFVDEVWVAERPKMGPHLHQPISFAMVWQTKPKP